MFIKTVKDLELIAIGLHKAEVRYIQIPKILVKLLEDGKRRGL